MHGLCYSSMPNVRSFVQCNAKCYLFNKHGKQLVLECNAMQCKKCINILQCTTLDRFCKTMKCCITYVISFMNMGRSQFGCAMQYNACIQSICYSSMHKVRSFVQCNACYCKYLKELVLVCIAMQCKKCMAYMLFFSAQRQIVCAMQCKMLSLQ